MTENKSSSNTVKYIIKPVSANESKNAIKESKKNQIQNAIIAKLNDAISTADKSVDEITLKPLQRIFSVTPNSKTLIKVRYGARAFYEGVIDEVIVKGNSQTPNNLAADNYQAKKDLLNQILSIISDNKEFSALYDNFLSKKSSSSKKSTSKKKSTSDKKSAE